MVIDELLRRRAVDLVDDLLLVGEEVVQFVRQAAAQGNAAFVPLVQTFYY